MSTDKVIFCVEPSWWESREHHAVYLAYPTVKSSTPKKDHIPLGSVEYCRQVAPWPAPYPYPLWLDWGRKTYTSGRGNPGRKFYKPLDVPKRFKGQIMDQPPDGEWSASDIVKWESEYRTYVIDGRPMCTWCYSDADLEDSPHPPWLIPGHWTGALDWGLTVDGQILPVEINHPYACGWYGPPEYSRIYAMWLVCGWHYMLRSYPWLHQYPILDGSKLEMEWPSMSVY